jgi:hypothetical protein
MPVKRKDLSTVGLETENIQELFRLGWYRVRPEGGTTLRIHNDFLPGLTPLLADMVKAVANQQELRSVIFEHAGKTKRL